jgi:hypothetical protein
MVGVWWCVWWELVAPDGVKVWRWQSWLSQGRVCFAFSLDLVFGALTSGGLCDMVLEELVV